jgi:hypothetical protein
MKLPWYYSREPDDGRIVARRMKEIFAAALEA